MIDRQGRKIDYIRISVTDRCNLRCVYCMPEEGIVPAAHEDILTYEEIVRLCELFAKQGIQKIKLTGGEPLARKGIAGLVARLHEIPGIEKVTLTTNGIFLKEQMEDLARAGIDGINISMDTLNPELFAKLTRRDAFAGVWEGVCTALKYPQIPLKVNCVPMGIPEQDIVSVAALARDYPIHVRFIEMMPIGLGKQYTFCSQEQVVEKLTQAYGTLKQVEKRYGNGPGSYYEIEGFLGKIGFISAISHKFCSRCNRIRLTSQGFLKSCLQYDRGCDLRKPLRSGSSDSTILDLIAETIESKPTGHQFLTQHIKQEEIQTMAQIGG